MKKRVSEHFLILITVFSAGTGLYLHESQKDVAGFLCTMSIVSFAIYFYMKAYEAYHKKKRAETKSLV